MKNQFIDAYVWNQWLGGPKDYSIKEGYKWLTGDQEKVTLYHWVWNKANIPKRSFISWLAALGKLRIKDKLYQAGVSNTKACPFCTNGEDSCSDKYFKCPYNTQVFQEYQAMVADSPLSA
ncbi:uncharacterized protein LOC104899353 [Beta vulgaris subsp. vulgaris]|uniref:uncharacterized protein LOC104899353 n=1 Tax=Beta vulgaris subsp. vulgaris TaxID=3555 RepID=UPI002036D380|nr:uncharacterized protein LOC104899353 [Beta vulgaris subsp. vulgaris]